MPSQSDIEVIAPNLKRRLSGVTATVVRLVPVQAKEINIRATGPGLPSSVPHIPLWRTIFMPRDKWRVWHARRNNDMVLGVFLRHVLRRKYKLVFTSSSPRPRGALTRRLVEKMDQLIATNVLNARVMPGVPVIIPHGVDTTIFIPQNGPRESRRIGCLGRVRPKKGTAEFVEAMCMLLPEFEGWEADIYGRIDNETYARELDARIEQAGLSERIHFHEPRPIDEMPDVYASLDLVVAPSHLEGFGLTPIEAEACGVPCVATRGVGCFDEAIIEGVTGALATLGDARSFADAIRPYMANDTFRKNSGCAARRHIVRNFSIEAEAQALIAIYRDLLSDA